MGHMKEVKLKINVEGMLEACKDISAEESEALLKFDTPKSHVVILDRMFKDNLEIEGGPDSNEEKENILYIFKKRLFQYFTYNLYGHAVMEMLYAALRAKKDVLIEVRLAALIGDIISSNSLIYSPGNGIYMPSGKNEPAEGILRPDNSLDLRSRTYTLEIDTAKISKMEGFLCYKSEILNRDFFEYIAKTLDIRGMDIGKFGKYLPEETCHPLDELYATPYENSSMPLVDYGLTLIHEKYYEIKDILEKIKIRELNNDNSDSEEISGQINELFPFEEDLKIVFSIGKHLQKIIHEKAVSNGMLSAMEYMAHSTDLLDKKKKLTITADLSDFVRDYITGREGLEEKVHERKIKVDRKIQTLHALENMKKEHSRTEKGENREEVIKKLDSVIDSLETEICTLLYNRRKEYLQINNIRNISNYLSGISPVQQEGILRKMEAFGKTQGIEVARVKKLLSIKLTRTNLVIVFILFCGMLMLLSTVGSNLMSGIKSNSSN
ncbi:hypothetical protein NEMIN01_2379 [Nematocida minor]|uniref:uncharacterized protein n=1 Tax=Nematocida minor TaxID=1912983 RepID=UPI002220D495|nr:uncharacterized protein NEMIN01_2379 [Nematocida minor]KAI5193041.1 hypothetical protein NEMIN01_2379 [Nematocida minor]